MKPPGIWNLSHLLECAKDNSWTHLYLTAACLSVYIRQLGEVGRRGCTPPLMSDCLRLKFAPAMVLNKWSQLVTLSTWSRDHCVFYQPATDSDKVSKNVKLRPDSISIVKKTCLWKFKLDLYQKFINYQCKAEYVEFTDTLH